MRNLIGVLIVIVGILLGLYIGGWIMFVKPIIDICYAIDDQTISAVAVGITIIKCLLASFVGVVIAQIGIVIGKLIMD